MINILHIRDTNKLCGPGKTILETACRIDQTKYNLYIGLLLLNHEDEKENLYYQAVSERGATVIPLRTRGRFDPNIINIIINVINKYNINIIHAHDYKSDIICFFLMKRFKIPVLTTAHGWITNSWKNKLYIELGKRVLPYFDRVIAVSPAIEAELLKKGVPREKLTLVYNAIVADDYLPSNFESGIIRKRFNIPNDSILIGNIGRLSQEKGQEDFLRAAALILSHKNNVSFVLAGDGPNREHLEKIAENLGITNSVYFLGHMPDIKPVFRDIDIMALTSYTEGFPNVILESLCMDTPVLATNVGGVSSIIEDGVTGILVNSGDIDNIARGLIKFINHHDFAKDTVSAGKKRLYNNFEFSKRLEIIGNIYDDLTLVKQ